jgi:uncharacterized membrane protein (GlpM family)
MGYYGCNIPIILWDIMGFFWVLKNIWGHWENSHHPTAVVSSPMCWAIAHNAIDS